VGLSVAVLYAGAMPGIDSATTFTLGALGQGGAEVDGVAATAGIEAVAQQTLLVQ
jgi:hypothetical protein